MHDIGQGTVVVTGGAGLIGSAIVWGINNLNLENIWVVDDVEPDSLKARNLEPLKFNKKIGVEEFRSLFNKKSSQLEEVKTVIHLGACSTTTQTNEDYLN